MKIYKDSFQDVRSHGMDWIRVASGPVLLWIIGAVILGITIGSSGVKMGLNSEITSDVFFASTSIMLAATLFYILAIVGGISLVINGYRYAVLRADGDRWLTLNLNVRFVKLILFGILVGILMGIYGAVSIGIVGGLHYLVKNITLDVIVGTILGLYLVFIFFRIALYQVAISVDHGAPLRTSWDLMKGNIWRLLALVILVAITVWVIGIVGSVVIGLITSLLYLGGETLALFSLILWIPFIIFILLLSWAANTKAVGLVYKELSKKK